MKANWLVMGDIKLSETAGSYLREWPSPAEAEVIAEGWVCLRSSANQWHEEEYPAKHFMHGRDGEPFGRISPSQNNELGNELGKLILACEMSGWSLANHTEAALVYPRKRWKPCWKQIAQPKENVLWKRKETFRWYYVYSAWWSGRFKRFLLALCSFGSQKILFGCDFQHNTCGQSVGCTHM